MYRERKGVGPAILLFVALVLLLGVFLYYLHDTVEKHYPEPISKKKKL